MIKKEKLYDNIVFFLLYWCTLQEVLLAEIYKLTSNIALTNLLFYSKDFFMLTLFLCALLKKNSKKLFYPVFFYVLFLAISFIISLAEIHQESVGNTISLFQNLRNFLVFPCFIIIGANINDKAKFTDRLIDKFFPFVVVCAFLGIVEYCLDFIVGTKGFWTSTIGYTNFYVTIKKQEGNMLYGLPANFYGSYGGDYFSVKRLVGPWANPLTSAYSMAIPTIYYYITFVDTLWKRKINKADLKNLLRFIIMLFAIYFTHTRLILIILVLLCAYYLLAFSKKKILLFMAAAAACIVLLTMTDWQRLMSFLFDGSTAAHILSVTNSIKNIRYTLLGNGLSYIGIYGAAGATESTYLTILGNFGIVGLAVFIYTYGLYSRCALKMFKKGNSFSLVVFLASVMFAISGLVSEQLFAYTTIAEFYILLGMNSRSNLSRKVSSNKTTECSSKAETCA